ncbi:MAG: sodium/proline symporter [Treponema sp.]|nr:sodium/proline symporter [Treponema sp.]
MSANAQMLVAMCFYMAVICAIGLRYSSRQRKSNPEEYFLARRQFGPWLTSLSAQASDMSGWLLMGLPGAVFFLGLGYAWVAIGLFLGTVLNWSLVAKRLRSYSEVAGNSITLPEFFSKRYHDDKRILLAVAALISLLFFSIYVGSQLMVVGRVFHHIFGLPMLYMIIIGSAVILSYTLIGGFLAVGVLDIIQSIIMVTALSLVMIFGVANAGGISGVIENLQNFPRFTDIMGMAAQEGITNGMPVFGAGTQLTFIAVVSLMAWGLGYFGMPQVLVRFMAINNVVNFRASRVIAIVWVFIAMGAAIAIGLIGRALYPGEFATNREAETVFILLSQSFFPPLLAGIIVSGILAASMSSTDSYMLIVSSSLANDMYKGIFNKNASERRVMWIARITMLVVTIFGVIVAAGGDTIFAVVAYAWAGLGASFGPLMLFSLFWKRTTFAGALAGMLTGGFVVVVWRNLIRPLHAYVNVFELLPAFILSCLVIFLVSLATEKPSQKIEKEFDAAKAAAL